MTVLWTLRRFGVSFCSRTFSLPNIAPPKSQFCVITSLKVKMFCKTRTEPIALLSCRVLAVFYAVCVCVCTHLFVYKHVWQCIIFYVVWCTLRCCTLDSISIFFFFFSFFFSQNKVYCKNKTKKNNTKKKQPFQNVTNRYCYIFSSFSLPSRSVWSPSIFLWNVFLKYSVPFRCSGNENEI